MKTKNFLLTGALFIVALFSVNGVMAAEGPSNYAQSGQTTVNIKLNPMQAIVVNHNVVNLEYTTLEDYNQGVETLKENHLTVYSVGGFIVNVKSNGNFIDTNGSSIDAEDVIITATAVGDSPGEFAPVTLSTSEAPLITSTTGGFAKNYNVNYSNKLAGQAFAYAGKEVGDYTATVTYEIIPAN
ncbi:MAG: hypothetical protein ACOX32_03480 [Bacteroidaceae bacterium]|jgi:hypothetical protein